MQRSRGPECFRHPDANSPSTLLKKSTSENPVPDKVVPPNARQIDRSKVKYQPVALAAKGTDASGYPPAEKITPPSPQKVNYRFIHYLNELPTPESNTAPVIEPKSTTKASESTAPAAESSNESPARPVSTPLPEDDAAAVDQLGRKYAELKAELGKVIIGQEDVIEKLAICLFARGHGLLMGVPGLAKTLLVSSVAETLDLGFNRIQFTPDLMPADISGTDIIQDSGDGRREFEFVKGPVFSNIVLADEINRAPAKTQSAMLEAMQERHVTVLGRTYQLDAPFFVLATQNPVEQEGTYPLPEAQLDRFMFLINVDYPTADEERRIARETTGVDKPMLKALLTGEEVLQYQALVRRVPVPDHIYDYAVEIVRRTRPDSPDAPEWLKEFVGWGAGPRAVQYLILGCKARAALRGTYMASLEDIEAVAESVLSHRVLINFAAESQGMTAQKIVARLVEEMRDDV